ncbi:MAG: Na/Pi cotransporter family protein [Tannerella sp.]|jgi:phosphate:Na+ symporter|nr:Na/Pi cotransporter family protein [Tannerella sp.]
MDYSFWDFLTLAGSLGLFLYGMKIMSEGLQKVAGDKMRNILSVMTTNRVTGAMTGVLITALIQSSSATSVMVVSFVNAGLLSLAQAISVIMGANVGTTVTAWIISLFGFKVDISLFALPLIGLSIPLIFSNNNSRKSWGEFIIGFAILFLGLGFLKDSVPDLEGNTEVLAFVSDYTSMGFRSVLLFLFIGAVLTIIVQSSSATVAITLIMCSKGWIPFEIAAAMVLGENIGTTVTANLAALSANIQARRAAFAHFMFNVFGVAWMLAVFYPFVHIIGGLVRDYGPGDPTAVGDPAAEVAVSFGLSLFHTLFNIVNIFLMIWFVNLYVKICSYCIKQKKVSDEEEFQLKFISAGILSTSELSLLQSKKEIVLFAKRVHRMFGMVKDLYYEQDAETFRSVYNRIDKYENISDRMELEIADYLTKVLEGHLSSQGKENIRVMLRVISEIESVADSCHNLARGIKRRNEGKSVFLDSQNRTIDRMFALDEESILRMIELLDKTEAEIVKADLVKSYNIETEINNYRDQLRTENLEKIDSLTYRYSDGAYYMDIVSECEKLADYVLNVAQAIVNAKAR